MGEKQFYEVARRIDSLLRRGADSEAENDLFAIVDTDPCYQTYFLQQAQDPCWLGPLKKRGYFSPQRAPGPAKGEEEGYFYFPLWDVLPYLEQISRKLGRGGNEEDTRELLKIMKDVTNYHVDNKRKLDNYRTWWYFVKGLLNLPNAAVSLDMIDLIPVWLDSQFDNSLPGTDIARKLLPKFLDGEDAEGARKAEKIIEAITAVKCKKKPTEMQKGLFGKEQEAHTVVDSYWLEETFKTNSRKVGERCSEKVLLCIADRLKQVFRCEKPEHQLTFENQEKEYTILVTHQDDFEFHCEVRLILREKDKDRTLEQKILDGVEFETEKTHEFPMHDCRDRTTFVKTMLGRIRENPAFEKLDSDLEQKMGYFYEGILSDYSYIWFPSIGAGPELSVHEAKETLAILLRDILAAKASAHPDRARSVLSAFQGAYYQYPIFKRTVIYTIAEKWDKFPQEFETILKGDNAGDLFDNPYYDYEISQLLKRCIGRLTIPQKEHIRDVIEAGPSTWLPDENQREYIARWKQKWYSVVKSDPLFAELHMKQVEATGVKEELSTKPAHFESRVGPGASPLTKDELLALPNKKLVAFLASFRTKDPWKGPTAGGLAEALQVAAESGPGKFVSDLTPFLDVGYNYVYHLLSGLRSAWNQKKPMDWEKLFEFLWAYTDREGFWQDRLTDQDDERAANHQWVTGMIGELIREGTQDDARAFPEELLDDAKRLLFMIFDEEKPEEHPGGDALSYALNSLHGKAITALVFLALRLARLKDKKRVARHERWEPDIRERYDTLLRDEVPEAYTFLGHYMPNLHYLDAAWMDDRIKNASMETNENLWAAFMEGYLLGARFYTDLYAKMKANYERGLDHSFKDDHVNRRLVEHIAWRYLDGAEKLDDADSLFRKLLNRWDTSQMENAIQFFWGQRDHLAKTPAGMLIKQLPPELEQRRQRIIDFWKWVYDINFRSKDMGNLADGDARILASLSKLTIFLGKIDSENAEWLMASMPHTKMDVGFDAPFFLEYLNDLKDADAETTKHVGRLLRSLAETSAPDFKQEHIWSIVEHLYATREKDNTQNANDICNIYGSKGLHFLRDLWEKHNPAT